MLKLRYILPTLFVFSLCFGLFKISNAQERTWLSVDPIISVSPENSDSYYWPRNTDCVDRVFTSLIYKKDVDTSLTEVSNSGCMVTNSLGSFGGNYVLSGGTGYGYKTMRGSSRTTSLVGVPNQPKFIMQTPSIYSPGSYFFVNDSLRSSGAFKPIKSNAYKGYVYDIANYGNQIKDPSGNPLTINNYAFSQNGEWLLMEVLSVGFVKMSLKTGEIQLVSNQTFAYGGGFTIVFNFAISNDGRYMVVSNRNYGTVNMIDSSNCQNPVPNFTIYSHPDPKCQTKDMALYIKSKVADYYWLSSLRFSPDDNRLKATLSQKAGNISKHSKTTLSLNDGLNKSSYIAMGDSFASGEGDMEDSFYEDGTNDPDTNLCHLSRRSYPYLLQQNLGHDEFHSVACSGAKIEHILDIAQYDGSSIDLALGEWIPGKIKQKDRSSKISPSYLTISIGGNDLGFGDIMTSCLLPSGDGPCKYANDPTAKADTAKRIADLYRTLINAYDQLQARTGDDTKIYVVGYPQFINPNGETCGRNVGLDPVERQYITKSITYANQVIKSAAESAGAYYLDIEDSLHGRNLCSNIEDFKMAVNGITRGDDKPGFRIHTNFLGWGSSTEFGILGNESFHPNQNGHQIMKDKILELTSGDPASFQICENVDDRACPDKNLPIPLPDANYFGDEAVKFVQNLNDPSTPGSTQPAAIEKAFTVKSVAERLVSLSVDSAHLAPGTIYKILLHSTPVEIGQFTVPVEGTAEIEVTIPENAEPGLHELHLVGQNLAGETVDSFKPIYISGQEAESDCGLLPESRVDVDQDGIDDACDGYIGQAPIPEEPPREDPEIPGGEETPTDPDQNQPPDEDPKKPLEESVAGLEDFTDNLNSSSQDSTRTSSNNLAYIQPAGSSYIGPNTARSLGENAAIASSTDDGQEDKTTTLVSDLNSSFFWLIVATVAMIISTLLYSLKAKRKNTY